MKKALVIILLLSMLLFSCDFFGDLFGPAYYGTWEYSESGMSLTIKFTTSTFEQTTTFLTMTSSMKGDLEKVDDDTLRLIPKSVTSPDENGDPVTINEGDNGFDFEETLIDYTIDGNEMTVSFDGSTQIVLTKK